MQAGLLALLGEGRIGEFQPVGGHLGVREAHLTGQAEDLEETRVYGGFAAGELYDAAGHRALIAQGLEHFTDGLEIRFVEIARGVGIGEADRAGEIAPVGQVDICQTGVAGMEVAEAAIVRAACGAGDDGVFEAAVVAERPLLHFQIELRVGINDVAKIAMVRTVLLHDDFAALFQDSGINQFRAIGAKRLCLFRQSFLKRLYGCSSIGSFGLYYLKLCHVWPL